MTSVVCRRAAVHCQGLEARKWVTVPEAVRVTVVVPVTVIVSGPAAAVFTVSVSVPTT